ncbi:MAG: AAA-like domain protein [bacterium ADurb.Bin212]|nr:MAG: AAA-like domain protein [bacterium ADurb.Bin212]
MYQNSYQYNNEPDQLAWWVYLLIAVAAVVILYLLWQEIRRWFVRRHQVQLTDDWVMIKVSVPKAPHADEDDQRKDFREMLSVIEPFYAALDSVYKHDIYSKITGQDHISVELIAKEGKIYFYVGCPERIRQIVEKNLLAQYPDAQVEIDKNYSIFPNKPLKISINNLYLQKKYIFPIKTYKTIEEDPINAITNSLSKLKEDELAGIQILLRPTSGMWRISTEKAAYNIQQGKTVLTQNATGLNKFTISFFNFLHNLKAEDKDKDKNEFYNPNNPHKQTPMQENQIKLLGEKASKLGFEVQIRLVAVAADQATSDHNLRQVISAFSQFNTPDSNGFHPSTPKNKSEELANYVYRTFSIRKKWILNTEELASIYHLPNRFTDTPSIAWLLAKRAAPPPNLPKEGTLLGISKYRGEDKEVRLQEIDRLRHVYMIGKTGVGKTVLFENMIMQDIREGKGVAYLDPNGDAAEFIMKRIPKERAEDVIYFNPADIDRPMGLNMLEWKTVEQKDFLVQEALQMFQKLFDPGQTGIVGPQFEHWMRNASLTLMAQPDGGTIIDIPRLFTDPDFEKQCVKNVTDPVVRSFWEKQMAKTSDFHKSEMLNYFTSKFGRFMTNDMMRNILGQTKSAFDFRDVMDGKKILICNLSKGLIGEINAFLLGMIIVSKIAMGAFSRQDMSEDQRTPFFLYVDEFQNFITDVFATILSESRKYKLSLNITNQYIAQLDEKIRDAVIGNAGTLVAFRIGAADAEFLVKEFDPLQMDDMTTIDKYNFYAKMLIDGAPTRPFNAQSVPPDPNENAKLGAAISELSRLKFGRDREVVDAEIKERSKVDLIDLPGINDSNQRGGVV